MERTTTRTLRTRRHKNPQQSTTQWMKSQLIATTFLRASSCLHWRPHVSWRYFYCCVQTGGRGTGYAAGGLIISPPFHFSHRRTTGSLRNNRSLEQHCNMESLRTIVVLQHKEDSETKGWEKLPPTEQHVILLASTACGPTILLTIPLSTHRFLNTCNTTGL